MHNIIPHLWFDTEAKEAVDFYVSLLPNSHITTIKTLHDTPSGDCEVLSFELSGQKFMAISAGPYFKFNPAISLLLNFNQAKDSNALAKLDELWKKLMVDGIELMLLEEYPFGDRCGWVQDKYGLSWQLSLTNSTDDESPFISPALM